MNSPTTYDSFHTIITAQIEQNPQVTEIIPTEGQPGCRCIVLGNHFKNEKNIQVFFGKQLAQNIRWHESGAILCNAPPFVVYSNLGKPPLNPLSTLPSYPLSSPSSPWIISESSSSSSIPIPIPIPIPLEAESKQVSNPPTVPNPNSLKEEENRTVIISVANDTSSAIIPSDVKFTYLGPHL